MSSDGTLLLTWLSTPLHQLPEGGLIPGEGLFKDFPKGECEWYLANLPKKKTNKKEGESQDGEGEPSSGGGQGGGQAMSNSKVNTRLLKTCSMRLIPSTTTAVGATVPMVKDLAKERLKDIIKKAGEEQFKNNSCSVMSSARKDIMKVLETKVVEESACFFVKASQRVIVPAYQAHQSPLCLCPSWS